LKSEKKIVKIVKESEKKLSAMHKIEPNPSKDTAMHEGDNPSICDEFIKLIFFLDRIVSG
jgi:hypothetical protein